MNTGRGQKVCTGPLWYGQRTKVGSSGGGCADEGVPLELRQSCDAFEVDHHTSFLCAKPLSYARRQLLQVCAEIFRAGEDCYGLLLRHTETCQPWDATQLSFVSSPLACSCMKACFFKLKNEIMKVAALFVSLCSWTALKQPLSHLLLTPAVIALTPTDVSSLPLSWLVSLSHCESSVQAAALGHNPLAGMRASPRASFSSELQCVASSLS